MIQASLGMDSTIEVGTEPQGKAKRKREREGAEDTIEYGMASGS